MKRLLTILILTAAVTVIAPARTNAAVLILSDTMTVFDPAGVPIARLEVWENGPMTGFGGIGTTGDPAGPEDPNAIYYLTDIAIDPAQFGNATTLLEGPNFFSDIFGVANVPVGLRLAFSSDIEGVPTPFGAQGAIFVNEGNGYFDATMYLSPELRRLGYTAQFFSDPEVPEPASLTLLGTGLLVAGLRARRMMGKKA